MVSHVGMRENVDMGDGIVGVVVSRVVVGVCLPDDQHENWDFQGDTNKESL